VCDVALFAVRDCFGLCIVCCTNANYVSHVHIRINYNYTAYIMHGTIYLLQRLCVACCVGIKALLERAVCECSKVQ
jgi:hypothetical protein